MKHLNLRTYAMVIALISIWIIFTFITEGIFLTTRNLSILSRQATVTAILAIGMVLVIISANIDLSVGFGSGLLGAITAILHVWWDLPIALTLISVISIGILIGVLHGFLIAYQRIPAFIVTLGGFLLYRGLMLAFTKGETILLPDNWLKSIGTAHLHPTIGWVILIIGIGLSVYVACRQLISSQSSKTFKEHLHTIIKLLSKLLSTLGCMIVFVMVMNSYRGIPLPVCILLCLAFFFHFIVNHTRFGRYVYAIGGNAEASYLSGINVRVNTMKVFALMGALMAIAGVVMTARLGSAGPGAGRLLELDAIAACVIGGASLMGGRGTIFGAILGAFVMASLSNGMIMANMGPAWQDIIKGVVLVAAVGFDMASRKQT